MFIRFTAPAFRNLLSIYVFSYFIVGEISWYFNAEKRQSILESCLFGNKYIIYRNSPIFISSFCKSITVIDIRNMQTNSFMLQNQYVIDFLIGWNAKYNKIKTTFSPDIIDIFERSLCTASNSKRYYYQTEFNLFLDENLIEPQKLKLKLLQNILKCTHTK